jgi:hypothetical protein
MKALRLVLSLECDKLIEMKKTPNNFVVRSEAMAGWSTSSPPPTRPARCTMKPRPMVLTSRT